MVMVVRFLLDTNVISKPTKPRPNQKVLRLLSEYSNYLSTATVAYHEISFGFLRMSESRKKREIEAYIRQNIEGAIVLLPYCDIAAKWHAQERSRLKRLGRTPPFLDGQIAAVAANNLTLVTRNVDDFQHFQDLQLENWFE